MILRIDRLQTELASLSDPDPDGASNVQELLSGSSARCRPSLNYTYQSFNFRGREKARPFYDLVSSIAAEEFGHIELVAHTIGTMLTGASIGEAAGVRNTQQFIAGGQGALCQDANGRPWTGDNVFSSRDLIEDLTHNFFLDYTQIAAVWNGKHPETGDDLVVEDGHPKGAVPSDPPPEPAVFAPDYAPEEIFKIAEKLKKDAGIS